MNTTNFQLSEVYSAQPNNFSKAVTESLSLTKVNLKISIEMVLSSGVPRNFFRGGGLTDSVEDRGQRGRGSGGGSPLVRGSGGSCNLVQEISFHIVKFS